MSGLRYQLFRMFVSILPWGLYIIFHNNVSVAVDVVFCSHDVMYKTFNRMGGF